MLVALTNVFTNLTQYLINKRRNRSETNLSELNEINSTMKLLHDALAESNANWKNKKIELETVREENKKMRADMQKEIDKLTKRMLRLSSSMTELLINGCKNKDCSNRKRYNKNDVNKLTGKEEIVND